MDIEFAFTNMQSAVTQNLSQDLANESIKMWNIVKEKSPYTKERIIIKYINIISKSWKYIHDNGDATINHRGKLKSIIDLVLKPLIAPFRTIEKWLENYTSVYFLQFIQGITLFHDEPNDEPNIPAYHRSASCGPKRADDDYNLANINCKEFNDLNDLFRKKRNSWNCYLERKIYDEMYITILNIFEQNFGHRLQLRHIEMNNFESCFPLLYFNFISINVLWTELIPIGLEIKYKVRDTPNGNFKTIIEKYQKKFNEESYLSTVSCLKSTQENNQENNRIITEHLTQSVFKHNVNWTILYQNQDGGTNKNKIKNNLQTMKVSARNKCIKIPILRSS
jgi:hypothetical protein